MSLVLIIADREDERQVAISRGLELASKMGWGAQVAAFAYESLSAMGVKETSKRELIRKKLLARRKTEVEAQVNRLKPSGLRVAVTVVWQKSVHLWIDQQCARKEYAAVIKTGHRTESFVYTPTDWHLLRECPAPVIIAAEKKWRATKPIVAAVDLTSNSRIKRQLNDAVISTAKRYAEALGCGVYVLHALHIPAVLTELDLVDEYSHTQKLKDELQPRLIKLASNHGISMKNIKLKQGPVEKVITSEAARLKAQLVVMGTVGRSGIKARLMGNTAERVLTSLRTDVLTLKPWA
ncbi:MAG: universal stress protein [Halieaceae bacterium]